MKFKTVKYLLLLILFGASPCSIIADSLKSKASFSNNIIETKDYTFSAIVDTTKSIDYRDQPFTPSFRYKMAELDNLTDSSIIVAGDDAHWLIYLKSITFLKSDDLLKIHKCIQIGVHSPSRIGILKYPDTNFFRLLMNIYQDSTVKFDLEPDFEMQGRKWKISDLKRLAKKPTDLTDLFINRDTLKIVSTADELYNPFGKFRSVACFELKYRHLFNKVPEYFRLHLDKNDTLFRMTIGSSFVKMFDIDSTEDEDATNRMEIISAKINDPKIVFANGVRIGLTKKRFLGLFFKKSNGLENITTIVLESGITGIWHYYYFEKDILKGIRIRTDFQINQD
jgi:hypothetical protein